jgi:nitrile hydratase
MSKVHDMGGRPDIRRLDIMLSDLKFKEDWEKDVFAITLALGFSGLWNLDRSRYARESLEPTDYLQFTYFEKWLAGLINLLGENGIIKDGKESGDNFKKSSFRVLEAKNVKKLLHMGGPTKRDSTTEKKFNLGETVSVRSSNSNTRVEKGHTRLPDYVKGKLGKVIAHHGSHVLPDANAHFLGESPEALYSVEFKSQDLWDKCEHAEDTVVVDLWESYLEKFK